VPKAV